MQGCVRGYGNYVELTSSGVDPTELFDDVEDNKKPVDFEEIPDIVVAECDGVTEVDEAFERRSSQAQLLPVEKARRRVKSKHSETDQNYFPVLDEVSLHTTPSVFSLVSIPDNIPKEKEEEVWIRNCYAYLKDYLFRTMSMLYQRRRELMELFPIKLTTYTCTKGSTTFFYFYSQCYLYQLK